MKYLSIVIALLLWTINIATAQNGYSVANAIPVDFTASNTVTFNNVSSQNSTGDSQGTLGGCSADCCSTLVYKVTTLQEGALYVESDNYTPLAGSMLCYTGAANASTNADLTFYTNSGTYAVGNSCAYRDTLFLGRGYRVWAPTPYWEDKTTWDPLDGEFSIPAGTYYIHFWNYNQQRSDGAASNLTFEFAPYCVDDQPEIEVEGNSVSIANGDDTPSTSDDTDFGTMIIGAAPVSKTFTIKNVSIHDLDINSATITGDDAANFSITASPAATVSGNSNTTFTVEFTPNATGENNATIIINNTDCDRALFNFDLEAFVLGTTPSSVRGNMITLDGSNDYVEINSVAPHFDGLDDFSFEAWVYVDGSFTGKGRIMAINDGGDGNGSGNFLFFVENGVLKTYDGNSTKTYGAADLKGAWHHVVVTHDNSDFRVYLNGELQDTKSASLSQLTSSKRWSLGQEFDSGNSTSDFFQGKMDEVRIWKDVRTQEEIQMNMNLSFTQEQIVSLENLVAYYQFDNDDATGTVDGVKDLLGNNGTLKNGGIYSASEVAVGTGVSAIQMIDAVDNYTFAGTDLSINFSGTLPNDNVVVTKITSEAALNPSTNEMTNTTAEYWIIKNYGTNTGLTATVKFNYANGFIIDNNTANYSIHKRGSNDFEAADWAEPTVTSVSSTAGDNHVSTTVTSFSQFYMSSNNVLVLPVELSYFEGQATEKGNLLTWQTTSEKDNKGFEIQRSSNGRNWEKIGFVEGKGTTTEIQNYNYLDENLSNNINYYRLKQIDFDGQFDYSNIVSIESKTEIKPIRIYPNPIQNELNIVNGEGNATVFNLLGQPVKWFVINSEQFSINMTELSEGQYILHIQKDDGMIITKKIMK